MCELMKSSSSALDSNLCMFNTQGIFQKLKAVQTRHGTKRSKDSINMCNLKEILDVLSHDKPLKSELAVLFYTIILSIFIMIHKMFLGNRTICFFSCV